MELVIQSVINGLIQGGFFALFAVGLVLIFGVMGVVNFAHGELVMVGAYTVWFVHAQSDLPYIPTIILAILIATVIGLLMERFLFRATRDNPLAGLICSIGVLFVLQVFATLIGGDGPSKQVAPPFHGTLVLFDFLRIPYQRIFSFGISVATLAALWYFLVRTKLGWALRAVALDREASALQGININMISMIAIGVGAALAGLAGALMAPLVNINPHMGHNVIITAFIVAIVGGVGSLSGSILAAILYALLHTFITVYYGATIATICGLLLMVVVLIVKPTGLMGIRVSE
ncbi:branched-chain amino acid ABC transporter permease [Candidatus Persebacteraceae bacterium Df01]|jgi:branched-chain amino acid transport system permease protein|uniref:Branched-chain amino acid ABC transporter permease n=1 Tax=Candidatus Doriopsillibacter californiensis TaxID=2970740 RepID=A0ABT7QML6_9GAMM|nr:branched-chain amino acid ABC transporter permease [Candidatus Persebacteraceae bacterium Df01]